MAELNTGFVTGGPWWLKESQDKGWFQQSFMQAMQMQQQQQQSDRNFGLQVAQFGLQQQQSDRNFGLQVAQFGLQQKREESQLALDKLKIDEAQREAEDAKKLGPALAGLSRLGAFDEIPEQQFGSIRANTVWRQAVENTKLYSAENTHRTNVVNAYSLVEQYNPEAVAEANARFGKGTPQWELAIMNESGVIKDRLQQQTATIKTQEKIDEIKAQTDEKIRLYQNTVGATGTGEMTFGDVADPSTGESLGTIILGPKGRFQFVQKKSELTTTQSIQIYKALGENAKTLLDSGILSTDDKKALKAQILEYQNSLNALLSKTPSRSQRSTVIEAPSKKLYFNPQTGELK